MLSDDDRAAIHEAQSATLLPYLILADGHPAGFSLSAHRSRLPAGIDADFVVHEFFVMHAYRGHGVAEQAAIRGFELHPGQWEVVTYPPHGRAIAFWNKVVSKFAPDNFSQEEVDHTWGRKVAFTAKPS